LYHYEATMWNFSIRQYRELKAYGSATARLNARLEELVLGLMATLKYHWVKVARTTIFRKECWVCLEVRQAISVL